MTGGTTTVPDSLTSSPPRTRAYGFAAAALLAIFFVHALAESAIKTPTSDEPPHIASGLSYLSTGVFRGNRQHPPLLKELSGLSMLAGGIRWQHTPQAEHMIHGDLRPGEQPDWQVGNELIVSGGPDRVLFWARLPFLLLATLGGAMLFLLGRSLVGQAAALGAVFLYVIDPTVVAHSYLVTMDVGLTALALVVIFLVWRYVHNPTVAMLACCGLAVGCMLSAKFSGLLFLPVIAALLAAAVIWPAVQNPNRGRSRLDPYYGATGVQSSLSAAMAKADRNDPCPCGSGKKFKSCHGAAGSSGGIRPSISNGGRIVLCGAAFLALLAIAGIVIEAAYFFPSDPLLYFHNMQLVNADHNPYAVQVLARHGSSHFYSYFAAAFLLKEPLAALALMAVGLAAAVRGRRLSPLQRCFLLLPPLVFFIGTSIRADDLGIRYLLPSMPFACLLGGLGLSSLLSMAAKWGRVAAVALCLWLVVAAVAIYPDDLSYFNESACLLADPGQIGFDGGSRCGTYWLDDSNVDWGGSMKQLKQWLDVNAKGRAVHLALPFGFPASAYGIKGEDEEFPHFTAPPPGLHAVSATIVARIPVYPGTNKWLWNTKPNSIVAHAIYIYDVPPGRSAQ